MATTKTISKKQKKEFAAIGRIGGKATAKKYGNDYMRGIAKAGATKRWSEYKQQQAVKQ